MNVVCQSGHLEQNTYKQSQKTIHSQSNSEKQISLKESSTFISCQYCLADRRQQILVGKLEQKQFSNKMNIKAINWIITTYWVNNFECEALYLAIVLFYCYKANRKIEKAKLQLLLLTLVYISLKKIRGNKLKIDEIKALSQKQYQNSIIVQMEAEILQIIDFNLEFQLTISELLWKSEIEGQNLNKLLFLMELNLFKSCQILFDKNLLIKLLNFIKSQTQIEQSIFINLTLKQSQILKKKYSSKFNVDEFIYDYK